MIKRFWWLLRSFFEGASVGFRETRNLAASFEGQPQSYQIIYAEFEQAISQWECRTSKKVERDFGEAINGERFGSEWKNFAAFLGSPEAFRYRQNWGSSVNLEKLIEEMKERQVQIKVQDEDNDYLNKLGELVENENARMVMVKSI